MLDAVKQLLFIICSCFKVIEQYWVLFFWFYFFTSEHLFCLIHAWCLWFHAALLVDSECKHNFLLVYKETLHSIFNVDSG